MHDPMIGNESWNQRQMGKLRGKHAASSRKQQNNVQRLGKAIHRFLQSETGTGVVGRRGRKVMTRKEKRRFMRSEKKDRKRMHKKGSGHLPEIEGEVERGNSRPFVVARDSNVSEMTSVKKSQLLKGKKSRAVEDSTTKMAEKKRVDVEDGEIKRLEKLLKFNKRKKKDTLPASFKTEGLDYVLAVTDPSNKNWSEDDDDDDITWLKSKRDKTARMEEQRQASDQGSSSSHSGNESSDSDDDDVIGDSESDGYIDSDDEPGGLMSGKDRYRDDDCDGSVSEAEDDRVTEELEQSSDEIYSGEEADVMKQLSALKRSRKRTSGSTEVQKEQQKYIPPQKLHKKDNNDSKQLQQLRKKVKGLINRLSEANLPSLLAQIEQLYAHNSRNEMNGTLLEALCQACVSPALLPTKFALEHMALVAALSVRIGTEIGAHILQGLATKLNELFNLEQYGPGKEMDNIVQLISHLYNFKVVHCLLIYDVIRKFIDSFEERDIELLLLILKNVGMAIRRDDPSSLKDIVLQIQSKAAKQSVDSSRMKFMLETISALRTNNARKIPNHDPSQVEHMLKVLRSLLPPGSLSESTLKISLNDLLNANKQGRWWIVGSAWSKKETNDSLRDGELASGVTSSESWVLDVARKQRMNTDLRKSIFSVMITSEDYVDAFEKLQRLGLKEVQEREIIHVLVDCCLRYFPFDHNSGDGRPFRTYHLELLKLTLVCGHVRLILWQLLRGYKDLKSKEKTFNPYYAYLGQRFCEFKRANQVTFQYTIWDRLKTLSDLPRSSLDNLWKLLSHLISSKALSLGVLRVVEFSELDKVGLYFLKTLLTSLLCDYAENVCVAVFTRILPLPNLKALKEALLLFMHHFLKTPTDSCGISHQLQRVPPSNQTSLLNQRIGMVEVAMKNQS